MSRTVFCRKYQKELPALAAPPLPGPMGQDIFEHVSAKAWGEWLEHQKLLINEKSLNLMDLTARTYLKEQMQKFFAGDKVDAAEGFVPPDKS